MKTLAFAIVFMCQILCHAQSNVLYGNVTSFGMVARTNLQMQLTIKSPLNRKINGNFISNDPIITDTDTNGIFSFTNVAFGYYILNAADSSGSRWPILVFTDTTGSNQLTDLVNFNVAIPQNGGTNYYTIAQVNALLANTGSTNMTWGTTTNQSGARPASLYFHFPPQPYNATNYPHGILTTN